MPSTHWCAGNELSQRGESHRSGLARTVTQHSIKVEGIEISVGTAYSGRAMCSEWSPQYET